MYNHVSYMGRLTKDPELRHVGQENKSVVTFGLAVQRNYKPKGAETAETDFFEIEMWNKSAEVAAQYLTKGQMILVSGRNQNDIWTDDDGIKHYKQKLVVTEWEFAGSKVEREVEGNENE